MDAEKALKLFDSFWFEHDILEKLSNFSFSSNSETNPDCENDAKASESEQVVISHTDSLSPNSVLSTSKLQSIFSETVDLEKARRRSRFERKSLPELEDKELKGFMDMGFVFTEEDMNSSLSLIIPGLNRLGKKDLEEEIVKVDESKISRPYLSEAWEVIDLERRMKEKPLLLRNWKLPSCLGNEIDMKLNLRCWAHTVAATVR